jgi:uncharacterized protein
MVSSGELALCFDARVLTEYEEVLGRPKFNFEKDKVAAVLDYVEVHGQTVAFHPLPRSLPDVDDEPFLEVALPPALRVSSQEIKSTSRPLCAGA